MEQLTSRLLTCYKVLASEKLEESDFLVAFTEMLPIQQLKELLFYDVKIAFIISAKHLTVRVSVSLTVSVLCFIGEKLSNLFFRKLGIKTLEKHGYS